MIFVQTERQNMHILCEELSATQQWDVADESGAWDEVR